MNTTLETKIRRKIAHKQSMYAELEQSRRPESWSATHPAYAGTKLCPDPQGRGGDSDGQRNLKAVHRRLRAGEGSQRGHTEA